MPWSINEYLDSKIFTEPKIQDTLQKLTEIIQSNSKVFLWVSGWMDSVMMSLSIIKYFQIHNLNPENINIIHCNHSTRKSNQTEQNFVENLFSDFNMYSFSFEQDITNKTRTDSNQTEQNLRNRRYSKFSSLATWEKDLIILWHNLTDRIESSFMNMLRWCHLNWFLSMTFTQNHNLINNKTICRPLINISKMEICHMCEKYWIDFVQDETNFDPTVSLRNKVRIDILNKIYTLANDNWVDSNSYLESYKNIFDELESITSWSKIILEDIPQNKYRNSDWAWKRQITKSDITQTTFSNLLKHLWIYNNISKPMLAEFIKFFTQSDSWYKFFNWTCFFLSNWNIYIIKAQDKFREKNLEQLQKIKPQTISSISEYIFDSENIDIQDEDLIWAEIRYTQNWDKYKTKTLARHFSNKKIAIFQRNFIIVIAKWNDVKKYFYNWKLN